MSRTCLRQVRGRHAIDTGILAAVDVAAMSNGREVNDDIDALHQRGPVDLAFEVRQLSPLDPWRARNDGPLAGGSPNGMAGVGKRGSNGRPDKSRGAGHQNPQRHPTTCPNLASRAEKPDRP